MKKICSSIFVAMVVLLLGTGVSLSAPAAVGDLETALAKAQAQGKPLFIQLGRETCGFCQNLKSYIKNGTVNIDNFIYVDLDCDNPTILKQFQDRFTISGSTLPFVVIADPNGKQISSRSGYGKPEDYKTFIEKAQK
ncbi:MAG: thioredoxin family protein [Syntrophales bacterium]